MIERGAVCPACDCRNRASSFRAVVTFFLWQRVGCYSTNGVLLSAPSGAYSCRTRSASLFGRRGLVAGCTGIVQVVTPLCYRSIYSSHGIDHRLVTERIRRCSIPPFHFLVRGLGRFRLAWTEVPAVRVTFIDTLFPGMIDFILIGGGKPDCRYSLHEQGISRHLSRQAGFFNISSDPGFVAQCISFLRPWDSTRVIAAGPCKLKRDIPRDDTHVCISYGRGGGGGIDAVLHYVGAGISTLNARRYILFSWGTGDAHLPSTVCTTYVPAARWFSPCASCSALGDVIRFFSKPQGDWWVAEPRI